jgi:hypothetical protein
VAARVPRLERYLRQYKVASSFVATLVRNGSWWNSSGNAGPCHNSLHHAAWCSDHRLFIVLLNMADAYTLSTNGIGAIDTLAMHLFY